MLRGMDQAEISDLPLAGRNLLIQRTVGEDQHSPPLVAVGHAIVITASPPSRQ